MNCQSTDSLAGKEVLLKQSHLTSIKSLYSFGQQCQEKIEQFWSDYAQAFVSLSLIMSDAVLTIFKRSLSAWPLPFLCTADVVNVAARSITLVHCVFPCYLGFPMYASLKHLPPLNISCIIIKHSEPIEVAIFEI